MDLNQKLTKIQLEIGNLRMPASHLDRGITDIFEQLFLLKGRARESCQDDFLRVQRSFHERLADMCIEYREILISPRFINPFSRTQCNDESYNSHLLDDQTILTICALGISPFIFTKGEGRSFIPIPLRHLLHTLEMMELSGTSKVVDLGSGPGLTVTLGSIFSEANFTGIELDIGLCGLAKFVTDRFAKGQRAKVVHGNIINCDLSEYSHAFLYEPVREENAGALAEHLYSHTKSNTGFKVLSYAPKAVTPSVFESLTSIGFRILKSAPESGIYLLAR